MMKPGVPAIKQKMIVIFKISNDQADHLIQIINEKLYSFPNIIILSENIILNPIDQPIIEEKRVVPSINQRYNPSKQLNEHKNRSISNRYAAYQEMLHIKLKLINLNNEYIDKINPNKADEILLCFVFDL